MWIGHGWGWGADPESLPRGLAFRSALVVFHVGAASHVEVQDLGPSASEPKPCSGCCGEVAKSEGAAPHQRLESELHK